MSCHYWVTVLFIAFCCPLWYLNCAGCGLPSSNFFWDSDRCGHWRFLVKCASRYWELTLRIGDGLVGALRGPMGGRKERCSTRICLPSRNEGREWAKVTTSSLLQSWPRDWETGCGRGEWRPEAHLPALSFYLFLWQVRLVGSQGMCTEAGTGLKQCVGGRKFAG